MGDDVLTGARDPHYHVLYLRFILRDMNFRFKYKNTAVKLLK